jgi:hypothetical protein
VEIDKLFGLPAHPFLVHIPVVLLPLAAIGAVAVAVRPSWRHSLGWVVVALAGAGLIGTQLAIGSGEPLEHRVRQIKGESSLLEHHTEIAEQLRPFAIVFFLLVLALMVVEHLARRPDAKRSLAKAVLPLAVLGALAGVATSVDVGYVGHTGARAAWDDASKVSGGEGNEGRGGGDQDDDGDSSLAPIGVTGAGG